MFRFFLFPVIVGAACTAAVGEDAVNWRSAPAILIGQTPKDAAVSKSGDFIYVLTETGNILIYSSGGQLEGTIHVGENVGFISAGPSDNQLLIGSGKEETVRMLSVEFVREIDTSGAPMVGLPDAPVTIAVFMDYQCPYCARLMPVLDQVLEKYPKQIKIVYKQYPLKMHNAALSAAAASLVAAREDRFRELHDLMFEDYKNLTDESILEKASTLGFDREVFRKEMASSGVLMQIQKDMQDGKKAGVSGIPAVFINGKQMKNRSLEGFQQMIELEIETPGQQPSAKGF